MVYTRHFFLICFLGIGILYICLTSNNKPHISQFNALRDMQQVLRIFNQNIQTVSHNDTDQDFRLMIQTRIPGEEEYIAPIIIKVVRSDHTVAGFIAYFMQNKDKGIIWVIAIDQLLRRRGYGKLLMKYAIEDLQNRGATIIGVWVLPNNIPAQTLYESLGFIKKHIEEDGDVYFECIA